MLWQNTCLFGHVVVKEHHALGDMVFEHLRRIEQVCETDDGLSVPIFVITNVQITLMHRGPRQPTSNLNNNICFLFGIM